MINPEPISTYPLIRTRREVIGMDDNKQKGRNTQDTTKKSDRTEFADEINVESKNKSSK